MTNVHQFSLKRGKCVLSPKEIDEIVPGSEKKQYKSINNKHMLLGSVLLVLETKLIPEYFENEEGERQERKEPKYLAVSQFKGEWSDDIQLFTKFTTALAWLELIALSETRKPN